MLPTLFLSLLATSASTSASPWAGIGTTSKSKRGVDEVWGGYNVTAAALEVRNSISSPTCNKTESCQEVINTVVPRCLGLQGSAGCWCGLEDPIHYCAICMLNPTDNTTSADQTQMATQGHMAFHEGCAAYAVSLNASATMTMDGMDGMTMTMSGMTMTGMSTATGTSSANDAVAAHKHSNTGPIVGGVVGGILGLVLIGVGAWLGWRHLQSKSTHATPYTGRPSNDHGGDQMAQHAATPYYGTGDNKTSSVYFGSTIQTPQQQPADLASNRLSYASHQPYPYSPAVSSTQAPYPVSASRDYDTSMLAALSSPPSQYGGNSTSSGGATQGPLMAHETGQTWTTNPITPPPPFAPSSSPGLPPGAKSPEYATAQPIGYTSGVPEAMSVEGGSRI